MKGWTRCWDGKEILKGSWELCQTKQWKDFRRYMWNEIIIPMEIYGEIEVKCGYCGWKGPRAKDTDFCLDHVVPYTEAPERWNDLSNILIACNHCNKKKGNLSLKEFLETTH